MAPLRLKNLALTSLLCAGLVPGVVFAQAEPFKDFTFRRIKPPPAGVQRRILIQIPSSVDISSPTDTRATLLTPPSQQQWFWDEISPALGDAASGRFAKAVSHLQNAPPSRAIAAPSLQDMRGLAQAYGTEILLASLGKDISPALILAMIAVHSASDVNASSAKDAQGLMRLMPATAARFKVTDPTDAGQNIKGGTAYLAWLLEMFSGDPILALAAYNAGENAVIAAAGVPEFTETRSYVPKVIAAWQVARALCLTPPELFRDGCVFSVKDKN